MSGDEEGQKYSSRHSTRDLLERIGMLTTAGEVRRSNPLSDPSAFKELTSRLIAAIDKNYDVIVVRDLFGDRVLGYQMSLITGGKPVAVSYDREGVIMLEGGVEVKPSTKALIAADTHFTVHSVRAAASGIEQAGAVVAGAAMFLQVVRADYGFPVWTLEKMIEERTAKQVN